MYKNLSLNKSSCKSLVCILLFLKDVEIINEPFLFFFPCFCYQCFIRFLMFLAFYSCLPTYTNCKRHFTYVLLQIKLFFHNSILHSYFPMLSEGIKYCNLFIISVEFFMNKMSQMHISLVYYKI